MPLYDIRCSRSNQIFERVIPLRDFEAAIVCACGAPAFRVISTPMFSVDNTDYTCPITGDYIGSKRSHENNLAKHGCRVLEPGERTANEMGKQAAEAAFERKVEATVEREIDAMPSDKREKLYNEMVDTDLAIERRTAQ